jgi:hypothetical protein
VPAQPVDDPGAFGDQVLSVIDQQAQVASGPIEAGGGQVGLLQRSSGHGQRVDGVGLPVGPRRFPGGRHHLGRHPDQAFPSGEEVTLETAGEVPAVLHRPDPLVREAVGPLQEAEMVLRRGLDRLLAQRSSPLVDGDHGVGALVRVDAEHHHGRLPPWGEGRVP